MSSVLKIVADETVKASQDMLEGIIQKTRRLILKALVRPLSTPVPPDAQSGRSSRSTTPEQLSDTSGALRSDDEFSSKGYSYESLKLRK